MTEPSVDAWFENTELREIEEVNIYPNVTVFNRKIYTFGDNKGEVYIIFSRINSYFQSIDELALFNNKACLYKISPTRWIAILNAHEKGKITVLGEISERYIERNDLNSDDTQIRDPKDYEIISPGEIYDSNNILDAESLTVEGTKRIKGQFTRYLNEIRTGKVNSSHFSRPPPP